MRTLDLHTVCESARCPNMGECWEHRTATFMILGNICTRACGFCAVPSGKPLGPPDEDEPERVAEAVERMGLRYAVVTSVNRDDQPDGGAAIFARTIARDSRARAGLPGGSADSGFSRRLAGAGNGDGRAARRAEPQYGNGAAALSPRAQGRGLRASLELLRRAREMAPDMPTKTGMMLGLGETREEVLAAMEDIAAQGTHILTLGQYLQPTPEHLPIERFVHPDEFAEFKRLGEQMGFKHVEVGPAGAFLVSRLRAGRSRAFLKKTRGAALTAMGESCEHSFASLRDCSAQCGSAIPNVITDSSRVFASAFFPCSISRLAIMSW